MRPEHSTQVTTSDTVCDNGTMFLLKSRKKNSSFVYQISLEVNTQMRKEQELKPHTPHTHKKQSSLMLITKTSTSAAV